MAEKQSQGSIRPDVRITLPRYIWGKGRMLPSPGLLPPRRDTLTAVVSKPAQSVDQGIPKRRGPVLRTATLDPPDGFSQVHQTLPGSTSTRHGRLARLT